MGNMNVFRILGDLSHTASKCILIWAIHSNQSAEGKCLQPCLRDLTDDGVTRCIINNPDALRGCLRHPLPRPFLDSAYQFYMELHPEELLHTLFTLYHLSHDESLCTNAGKRKGVEIRGILSGGVRASGAHRNSHCPREKF